MGCEELQGGVSVAARQFDGDFAFISLPGSSQSLFTVESELTNKVPGQTDAEAAELTKEHVNNAPHGRSGTIDQQTYDAVHLLMEMPINSAIPTGIVHVLATPLGGGATVCPDEETFARWTGAVAARNKSTNGNGLNRVDMDDLDPFGCSYFPPGTKMISLGPNEKHSMAIVSVVASNGREVRGVTNPGSLAQLSEDHSTISTPSPQITDAPVSDEESRHALAVKEENDRHDATVTNIQWSSTHVQRAGESATAASERTAEALQTEEHRHSQAMEQEEHLDSSAGGNSQGGPESPK